MFGPMGSGKSTVFKAITALPAWRTTRKLGTATDEKRRILLQEAQEHSVFHWLVMRMLTRIPVLHAHLVSNIMTASAWKSLGARNASLSALIQHVLDSRSISGPDFARTLQRLTWFVRELADTALLEEFGQSSLILHDESLLQRGLGLSFDDRMGDEFLERYCELVPLPDLVIYVNVPVPIAEQRVMERQRTSALSHLQHLSVAHSRSMLAVEKLRSRGCRVLELDGLQKPVVNAKRCLETLMDL